MTDETPDRRLIDVSHAIEDGMITYKGLPAPVVCDYLSHEDSRPHYAEGAEFQLARIDMVTNAGTYLDSLNIDDTDDGSRPVHTALLGADIPIVEHLRGLDRLPDHGFRFFATPVKVRGVGSFPVRAFALLTEGRGGS